MIKFCGCVSPKAIPVKVRPGMGHSDVVMVQNKNLKGHLYQDRVYGKGRRVMTRAPKADAHRCSVCGNSHN